MCDVPYWAPINLPKCVLPFTIQTRFIHHLCELHNLTGLCQNLDILIYQIWRNHWKISQLILALPFRFVHQSCLPSNKTAILKYLWKILLSPDNCSPLRICPRIWTYHIWSQASDQSTVKLSLQELELEICHSDNLSKLINFSMWAPTLPSRVQWPINSYYS